LHDLLYFKTSCIDARLPTIHVELYSLVRWIMLTIYVEFVLSDVEVDKFLGKPDEGINRWNLRDPISGN
jgi:hypothetical protein